MAAITPAKFAAFFDVVSPVIEVWHCIWDWLTLKQRELFSFAIVIFLSFIHSFIHTFIHSLILVFLFYLSDVCFFATQLFTHVYTWSCVGPLFTFNSCLIIPSKKLEMNYTLEVKGAFLQAIFDQGNLSSPSVPDTEIVTWVNVRLRPLLHGLSTSQVALYFSIIKDRSCNISREGWDEVLNWLL